MRGRKKRTRPQTQTATRDAMLSLLTSVKAALWDEAPAEQRKLTLQLGRNSFYFATAVFFIKQFGEQVAV